MNRLVILFSKEVKSPEDPGHSRKCIELPRPALEITFHTPTSGGMAEPFHIVCPHCETINRILASRLDEVPNCGHCHQRLFSGQAIELNHTNFQKYIERNDVPVVVDFWAPWCGPCQMMGPQYSAAAGELEPKARLAKLNTEAEPALASKFGIRSIPTVVLFKAGREVARRSGSMSSSDIVRWVRANA